MLNLTQMESGKCCQASFSTVTPCGRTRPLCPLVENHTWLLPGWFDSVHSQSSVSMVTLEGLPGMSIEACLASVNRFSLSNSSLGLEANIMLSGVLDDKLWAAAPPQTIIFTNKQPMRFRIVPDVKAIIRKLSCWRDGHCSTSTVYLHHQNIKSSKRFPVSTWI